MSDVFQLKGSLFTLSVLHIYNADISKLEAGLAEKLKIAPKLFNHTPIIVDVKNVITSPDLDLVKLVQVLKKYKLIPVAIRGGDERIQKIAQDAGLAIMQDSVSNEISTGADTQKTSREKNKSTTTPRNIKTPSYGAKLITQPIRSGQQIYAKQSDLIIINKVSPGAELIADGNIHVYGTLHGRALAGASGDVNARIFCHELKAELVAIAGQYRVFDEGAEVTLKGAQQIYLDDMQLMIEDLK